MRIDLQKLKQQTTFKNDNVNINLFTWRNIHDGKKGHNATFRV